MPERKYTAGGSYRYGFNGKEDDKDISAGGQDYGMRIYDSRLGRFLSVDPLTLRYPYLTPYQFASNSPIVAIDLDGLEFFKKDNFNYRMDYKPVVDAPGVLAKLDNAAHNVMALLWNGTFGALGEAGKSANNYLTGGYKEPATNIVTSFDQFQNEAYKYHTQTPLKQQLKDFGKVATDLKNYEIVPSLIISHTISAPKVSITEAPAQNFSAVGSTGQVGENYLKRLGGVSQKYFATEVGTGGRFVDQFVNGVANESKVGYTTLTKDIRMQIAKDVELMGNSAETGVKKVVWNFFESPVTGKAGASKPLQEALKNAGIETKVIRKP